MIAVAGALLAALGCGCAPGDAEGSGSSAGGQRAGSGDGGAASAAKRSDPSAKTAARPAGPKVETEKFSLAGRTFMLEVARTDGSRAKGLGGRESIPEDGGMIFIFPRAALQSFWMYETLIDLDIVFVDPRGFVTAIHTMPAEAPRGAQEPRSVYEARLRRYSSNSPAQFALEFRAGTAKELGLAVDQKLPGDWARLRTLAR
ncbi:MAG TPA: DUF192 domain-containing protein [Phycisphaerales bacterium]|nr:DUF192 domain-containing protein [Phycisphaerales bacterium]HMP38324.1 DUF192 domain-containing protein [Phycisphaerales bacterium]